jgi:hypothetical protein
MSWKTFWQKFIILSAAGGLTCGIIAMTHDTGTSLGAAAASVTSVVVAWRKL